MASTYDKDYYQALKDENYKALLQSEIQLDSARQRAMKNTQTQLAAQGMANSGYGSTNQTGIEGQYLTGLQNAQQNYQNQNLQIDQNKREAESAYQNEQFNSLTALMSGATSNDELNNLMVQQGYGTVGDDGKFAWNQQKLAGMNQDDALQLQSIYGMYDSQLATNAKNTNEATFANTINNLSQSDFDNKEDLENWKNTFVKYDEMTDEQKKQFDYLYNKKVKELDTSTTSGEINNQINNMTTTYSDITANGSKFNVSVNGRNYTPAVGGEADDQNQSANHKTGDIWVQVEDTGTKPNLYLVIKGNDGKTHYIDTDRDNLKSEEQLQFYADVLTELGYKVQYTSGSDTIIVNGVKYEYDRTGTDSIEEI